MSPKLVYNHIGPVKPRPSLGEVLTRISECMDLIGKHYDRREILEWASRERPEWGVGDKTIEGYIIKARKKMVKLGMEPPVTAKSRSILELRTIYKEAMRSGQVSTALMARKELNRVQGIYEVKEEVIPVYDGVEESSIDDLMAAAEAAAPAKAEPEAEME